ncbi:hypothetical protein IW262DRAFT_1293531 [Armillaria fumosa]|nr:hypothetical protein IW262DRAFT_1293531 [Armillaria fumosa]
MECIKHEAVVTLRPPENGAPPWFEQVQAQLNRLEGKVDALSASFTALSINFNTLSTNFNALLMDRSSSSCTGITGPFREVPFCDGTQPWGATVQSPAGDIVLPRLVTAHDFANLTLHQSYSYFKGYYPDDDLRNGVNARQRCIQAVFRAIERSNLPESFH